MLFCVCGICEHLFVKIYSYKWINFYKTKHYIYIYTHTHTTNVSPILFISTKTINRYSQHEGRHDEHTYCLLDLKFQNETYMIHIFICIFLDIKIFWCQTWIKIFLFVFTQFVVCIEISTMLPQCIKKKTLFIM